MKPKQEAVSNIGILIHPGCKASLFIGSSFHPFVMFFISYLSTNWMNLLKAADKIMCKTKWRDKLKKVCLCHQLKMWWAFYVPFKNDGWRSSAEMLGEASCGQFKLVSRCCQIPSWKQETRCLQRLPFHLTIWLTSYLAAAILANLWQSPDHQKKTHCDQCEPKVI